MKTLLLVCVLALMTFASVTAAPPKDKTGARGLLEVLAPVYARYYVCYSCGSRYNKSKNQCDADARRSARQAYTRVTWGSKLNDRLERLRRFLNFKYQTDARRWCGADWVKKYI